MEGLAMGSSEQKPRLSKRYYLQHLLRDAHTRKKFVDCFTKSKTHEECIARLAGIHGEYKKRIPATLRRFIAACYKWARQEELDLSNVNGARKGKIRKETPEIQELFKKSWLAKDDVSVILAKLKNAGAIHTKTVHDLWNAASILGLPRRKELASPNVQEPKHSKFSPEALIDFLNIGRTMPEITEELGIEKETIEKILFHEFPKEYKLYTQNNAQGDKTYVALKESGGSKMSERIWTFRHQAEGQPYLSITFPDSLDLKKIKILPLADAWFGDNLHDSPRFDEYIQWIAKNKEAFVILNGNILRPFKIDEEYRFYSTILALKEKLRPIAHKILWALSGGNEEKSARSLYDPLGVLCDDLAIEGLPVPHYTEPVYADIHWRGNIFTFFCFPGMTTAQTKGGKINAAIRPTFYQEVVNFTIMGKAMDKMVMTQPRISRNTKHFKLEYKGQYVVICPSFKRYFGSAEAKKGYKPPSWGTVSCNLFSDGKCEYST